MNLANSTAGSQWVMEKRMGTNADQDEMKQKTQDTGPLSSNYIHSVQFLTKDKKKPHE
jgi:hypothetical protein